MSSVLGTEGTAAPAEGAAVLDGAVDLNGEAQKVDSIYGDLKVEWPEGLEADLQNDHSLKPFVDQEGKLNVANVLKSYVHTKRKMGENKTTLPGENATEQELDEFYEKLGYKAKDEEYAMDKVEEDLLQEDFIKDFRDFARSNRMPLKQANDMANFLREKGKTAMEAEGTAMQAKITAGVDGLKEEYGQAFDYKVSLAQRVLNDVVEDPAILEALKDPTVGSNPAVIKTLVKIGEKLFKEDGFGGEARSQFQMTASEAQIEINKIYGDRDSPYHKKDHPSHGDAVKKMNKLFEIKNQVQ